MKSNHKIVNRRNPFTKRELAWFIYKWFLIGVAMYLCYRCLHISPLAFEIKELALCSLVIIGFTAIIKHHTNTQKATKYPNQTISPSPFGVIGWILSFAAYLGLFLYGFYKFCFMLNEILVDEKLVKPLIGIFGWIMLLVALNSLKFIINSHSHSGSK